MTVTLVRSYYDEYTSGEMSDENGVFLCHTLELPWRDNANNISCIPEGEYNVTKEPPIPMNDPAGRAYRPYWHFRVHNVASRRGILFHRGNHVYEIQGCIIPGKRYSDIDNDGVLDIVDSTQALIFLIERLPNEFVLRIVS